MRAMQTIVLSALCIFGGVLAPLSETFAQNVAEVEADLGVLSSVPSPSGHSYKCSDMARVVNSLRRLGKEEALSALNRFVERTRFDGTTRVMSVFNICRCLFEKPNGWDRPDLGQEDPPVTESAIKKLPEFPLMFSDGVPFLVIEGYILGGRSENPATFVKKCESLALRSSDLPTEGYERAAQSLVSSAMFRSLYSDAETTKKMAAMIIEQARENNGFNRNPR